MAFSSSAQQLDELGDADDPDELALFSLDYVDAMDALDVSTRRSERDSYTPHDAMEFDLEADDLETTSGSEGHAEPLRAPAERLSQSQSQSQSLVSRDADDDVDAQLIRETHTCLERLEHLVALSASLRPALLLDSAQGKASHLLLARYHAQMFLFRYAVALGLAQDEDAVEDAEGPATMGVRAEESGGDKEQSKAKTRASDDTAQRERAPVFTTIDLDLLGHDAPPSFDFSAPLDMKSKKRKEHREKDSHKEKDRTTKDKGRDKGKEREKLDHDKGVARAAAAWRRRAYESSADFRVNPQSHRALNTATPPRTLSAQGASARAQAALVSVFSVHPHVATHHSVRTSAAGHRAQHAGGTRGPQPIITKPRHPHKARKKARRHAHRGAAHATTSKEDGTR